MIKRNRGIDLNRWFSTDDGVPPTDVNLLIVRIGEYLPEFAVFRFDKSTGSMWYETKNNSELEYRCVERWKLEQELPI